MSWGRGSGSRTGRGRPPGFSAYRHEDLTRTFAPVIAELRQSLSAVLEQTATHLAAQGFDDEASHRAAYVAWLGARIAAMDIFLTEAMGAHALRV